MAASDARTDQISEEFIHKAATALDLTVPPGPQRRAVFEPLANRSTLRGMTLLLVAVGAFLVAILFFIGNPLDLLSRADPPAVTAPPSTPLRAAPLPPQPPEGRPTLMPPPAFPGSHAVIVGTYRTPQQASSAEQALRERALPVYALDLRYADGVRRRLLIGRYRSRAEAERARADVATVFADARVAHWSEESIR